MNDLNGKVGVVTGASRGLGRRLALRLAQEGASVALLARSDEALGKVRREIVASGGRALVVPADISKVESVDRARDLIERELGSPTILVNAAGVFGPINLVRDTEPLVWIETIMINSIGPYLTCRAFVGGMIENGWGRIVNVTSAAALHEPGPANSAYATSKAALNQFTRHLASELRGTGVTANVIHPGDVKTDMWADIRSASERLGIVAEPFTRWANWVEETGGDDPEKAADLVCDLLRDTARDINGQFLWIRDGLQAPIRSWGEQGETQPWRK